MTSIADIPEKPNASPTTQNDAGPIQQPAATANIDKVDSTTQTSANSTPQVVVVQQRKPSFKEEVVGYAKEIRGTILRKPETKEHGEKILSGEASFNPKQRE